MDMDQIVNVSHQKCQEKEHSGEYDLPGFRFHPTEQELLGFYLKKMVLGKLQNFSIIGVLDLYRYDPWDLPSLAPLGERQWFFFVPRDRKVQNGGRSSRITASGFWKGTGSDKEVFNENLKCIGLKKTLVFYKGRAPRGQRTDWVMNEYRMPDYIDPFRQKTKKDVVLCRIHRKATSLKSIEERAMSELAEEHVMHDQDMDCGKLSEETVFSDRDEKPIKYRLPVNSHEDCNTSAQSEPEMFSVTEILPIAPESCQCSALQLSQEVSSQQASHDNSSQIYASTATGLDLLEAIIGDDKKPSTEAFSVCKNDTFAPMNSFSLNTDALPSTISKGEKRKVHAPAKLYLEFTNVEASMSHLISLENSAWADLWTPSNVFTPSALNLWCHTSDPCEQQ